MNSPTPFTDDRGPMHGSTNHKHRQPSDFTVQYNVSCTPHSRYFGVPTGGVTRASMICTDPHLLKFSVGKVASVFSGYKTAQAIKHNLHCVIYMSRSCHDPRCDINSLWWMVRQIPNCQVIASVATHTQFLGEWTLFSTTLLLHYPQPPFPNSFQNFSQNQPTSILTTPPLPLPASASHPLLVYSLHPSPRHHHLHHYLPHPSHSDMDKLASKAFHIDTSSVYSAPTVPPPHALSLPGSSRLHHSEHNTSYTSSTSPPSSGSQSS